MNDAQNTDQKSSPIYVLTRHEYLDILKRLEKLEVITAELVDTVFPVIGGEEHALDSRVKYLEENLIRITNQIKKIWTHVTQSGGIPN